MYTILTSPPCLSQIRVLVHTTAGQVMEPTCDDAHTTAPHNRTGHHDNSVSMEITLATTPDSSLNTTMIDSFADEVRGSLLTHLKF